MPIYNKLIRDKIPQILESENKKHRIRTLSDHEFEEEVINKIGEEFKELSDAETTDNALEELADLLELIYTAAKIFNSNMTEIENLRENKKEKKGGFDKQIFLIDVED